MNFIQKSGYQLALFLLASSLGLLAGETPPNTETTPINTTIVVTANRMETPMDHVGSTVTVITRVEIEASQATQVLDLLRAQPTLDVVQNGGRGGSATVMLRGAKSGHTLVMIDGIELNDAMSPGRTYDLSGLSTQGIERIEIIRGPQSMVMGSDAMGGVINIITRKGENGAGGDLTIQSGSFGFLSEAAGYTGRKSNWDYGLNLSHQKDDGFSMAQAPEMDLEADGFEQSSLQGSLGWTPNPKLKISLMAGATENKGDLDNSGGIYGDDPNFRYKATQSYYRVEGQYHGWDQRWTSSLSLNWSRLKRDDRNDVDDLHPLDSSSSHYQGEHLKWNWQNNLVLSANHVLVIGAESQQEQGNSTYESESFYGPYSTEFPNKSLQTDGFYSQDQWTTGALWTTFGARYDNHERFGGQWTYRLTTSWNPGSKGPRFHGSLGTGFKAPTLYQLFSDYGSIDLNPESSLGWDLGLDYTFAKLNWHVGMTVFQTRFEDLIDFNDQTWTYENISESRTRGVEFMTDGPLGPHFRASFHWTYNQATDLSQDLPLLRRPENKGMLNLEWHHAENIKINLQWHYTGTREDLNYDTWPAQRLRLDSYSTLNLAGTWTVSGKVDLFARIENLFDKQYQEVLGYATPGLSVYGGFRYPF